MVLLNNLVAHSGFSVIESFYETQGDYVGEVLIALVILGKENQVVICPVLIVLKLGIIVPGNIHLAANDRLYLVLLGLLVPMFVRKLEELLYSVHVAMVCNGQGRHAHGLCPVEQGGYRREAVEYGVLRVDVKMYEGHFR